MIAGIELGKEYVQVCVKTGNMKEPESVTTVAGTEHYRIPTDADIEKKAEAQELFRRLWKMLAPYGSKETLESLVFCLHDNSETMRQMLLEVVQIHNISMEKVRFLDKKESFCAYLFHQEAELLSHNALLIENLDGKKSISLLYKHARTTPVVAEVRELSGKTLDKVFTEHAISSVFLVGDDYEEAWMQQNLKVLKSGKRVFVGKNLFVKGACYYGMEQEAETKRYLYLGEGKVCCNIAIKALEKEQEIFVPIVEGGKNWYESNTSLEVLLMEDADLEFAIIPIHGKEKMTTVIHLNGLPKRPPKTTRMKIELTFTDSSHVKLAVKDLGFGELFPQSDMVYEGELKWEQ